MKKFLTGAFVAIAATCGTFGLSACDDGKTTHIHDYAATLLNDALYHWSECKNDGCDEKIKDKTAHADNDGDGICDVCGYVIKVVHKHAYAATWTAGTYSHWHECQNDGCDEKIKDSAYHVDANDDYKCDICNNELNYTKNLTYMYLGDSYAIIGRDEAEETSIIVPPTHKGKPVTHVGNFGDDRPVHGIHGLIGITLPDSVTTVAASVFTESTALEYNEYENGLYLGNENNPHLVLVKAKNNTLTSFSVNENTKVIAYNAFYNCAELTDISLPESVEYVGANAFWGCDKLNFNEYDNGLYLGNENNRYRIMIKPKNEKITSCAINEKTIALADRAFVAYSNHSSNCCVLLKSVTLGNALKSIGMQAFYGCNALTEITIPESVEYIGSGAFDDCFKLAKFTVATLNTDFAAASDILYNKTKTKLVAVPKTLSGSFDVPASVTQIGAAAFKNCNALTAINIPNGVISIGFEAFAHVRNVENIVIPDSVKLIGGAAFLYCYMKTLTIGSGVEYIDWFAFRFCERLRSVVIPDGVSIIGKYAFNGCTSLKDITLPDGITVIDSVFSSCYAIKEIVLPASITRLKGTFFCDENLFNITYSGTKEQWESVIKDSTWDYDVGRNNNRSYTVHCSDGDIVVNKLS